MGKLLVLCAAILACASTGSALYCYKCAFTIWKLPCITSNVTCDAGEVCATIKGSAAGHGLIRRAGCLPKAKCDTNNTETFAGISYTTSYTCCDGNACNSAPTLPSTHLSLSMVVAMLGIWLTRLL